MSTPPTPFGDDFPCCTTPSLLTELADRIAFLENTCKLWANAHELNKQSHREHRAQLRDRIRELEAQRDRVTDLFESWAVEENEHRLANEFGIAEGLKVAIDGLLEAVHGQVTE